ncbi:MAG: hypothetical protein ABJZ55_22540 [Fuerstiella sp.]
MQNRSTRNTQMLCNLIAEMYALRTPESDHEDEYWAIPHGLLANRFACFPFGPLPGTAVSLVSSRLPERRDLCSWWYDILRTACARCDPETEYLLAVPGTTCFEAVVRASELFGIPRVEFEVPTDDFLDATGAVNSTAALAWCRSRVEACLANTNCNELVRPAILSCRFSSDDDIENEVDVPLRDVLSFDFAERVLVLHSRKKGTVHGLCRHYLEHPSEKIVMLAQTPNQPKAEQDLIEQGAVPWFLFDDHSLSTASIEATGVATGGVLSQTSTAVSVNDGPIHCPEEWLCHWTRPFRSAWPDQSPDEFLDELILGCQSADRSAIAALIRILQQRKLIATVARANEPATVSMTAVPLVEFRTRRTFRAHRRRYDFEPYGVAFRKSVMVQLCAEPVQYLDGDAAVARDSLFQQPRFDRTGKIDWSREKEWRLKGDLELSKISECDFCVFVNDEIERDKLERLCSSLIVVVPAE